jgi:hypothetical protein
MSKSKRKPAPPYLELNAAAHCVRRFGLLHSLVAQVDFESKV